jgi:hypothetical protein
MMRTAGREMICSTQSIKTNCRISRCLSNISRLSNISKSFLEVLTVPFGQDKSVKRRGEVIRRGAGQVSQQVPHLSRNFCPRTVVQHKIDNADGRRVKRKVCQDRFEVLAHGNGVRTDVNSCRSCRRARDSCSLPQACAWLYGWIMPRLVVDGKGTFDVTNRGSLRASSLSELSAPPSWAGLLRAPNESNSKVLRCTEGASEADVELAFGFSVSTAVDEKGKKATSSFRGPKTAPLRRGSGTLTRCGRPVSSSLSDESSRPSKAIESPSRKRAKASSVGRPLPACPASKLRRPVKRKARCLGTSSAFFSIEMAGACQG